MRICPSLLFSFFWSQVWFVVSLLSLNPFSPKIYWLILLTVSHTFPSIFIWEFAPVYYFPFFHRKSGLLVVFLLSLHTFSPEIYWLILLAECHTFPCILIWEFAPVYYFPFFSPEVWFVVCLSLLVPRSIG